MKKIALLILAVSVVPLTAQPTNFSSQSAADFAPAAILATMKRVADWQLEHPSPTFAHNKETNWTYGAFYTGVMALDQIADTPKYHDAIVAVGRKFNWQPGPRPYHADDQCVGQTYLDLYLKERDPAMLAPMKERFDFILANPKTNDLHFNIEGSQDRWSWCDALFMAPPTWARMYRATGDARYLNFMDREWRATSDFLYDTNEHLFFRDSTYFARREASRAKIFWSRGNGWVLAGLTRIIPLMPRDFSGRDFYIQRFKEMAAKIASLQQADGLWRASLLDPASYPLKETSGSGFDAFALSWGINYGMLDRHTYEPIVRSAWSALVECVTPEGRLEHVQPIGADPKKFRPTDTEVYGSGAFLLAGREIYQLSGGPIPSAK
jgi:unsaturated rhamnogalacturonyl hydrolase